MRRAAVTVLVLALLVATTAAFALTEALKLERSPIARPRFDRVFSPVCNCPQQTTRLVLRLRRANTIDAVIVDSDGEPVRTLLSDSRHPRGRLVLRWSGRNDAGEVVPDGNYRLRLHFADERRTIVIPNRVRVDSRPPAVELISFAPRVLSPDGDGREDVARIEYRSSERARPLVLVDDAIAARGRFHAAGQTTLVWRGRKNGTPLRAGLYSVAIRVRDRAGNLSEPTAATAVSIRYIDLVQSSLTARRAGILRFGVSTDARGFRWTLRARNARRAVLRGAAATTTVRVRLPRRISPGRYVLRVGANGHADEADVTVRPRR